MILDNNLSLGSSGSITSVTTTDLPDVVDLRSNTNYGATASGSLYTIAQGTQTVDIGAGNDLLMIFTVTTAFAGTGTTTATFQAVTDSTDNLDTTPLVCGEVGPIPFSSLTVGAQVVVRITPQQSLGGSLQRYLGANIITAGSTVTAGAVRGDIVLDIQDRRNYAGGFVVS
jgi:hypothetical protein